LKSEPLRPLPALAGTGTSPSCVLTHAKGRIGLRELHYF